MKIVFFMPLAARTGSEVALLNLISYAARKTDFEIAVACRQRGELLSELPFGVQLFLYDNQSFVQKMYAGASSRLRRSDNSFTTSIHQRFKADIWYINTIVQPEYVSQARKDNIPCVVHTHEREQMLNHLSQEQTLMMMHYPRLLIASSETARNVFYTLGRQDHIEVCYPTINPEKIRCNEQKRKELRQGLNITDQTFVWAMSGSLDPNKNPGRFVAIATEMLRNDCNAHFVWLGGGEDGYSLYVKQKARESGFAKRISFLGPRTTDYYDWLNAADGVVVTSFSESFSLVSVEAAYLGKPVVSFNCGGVKEIISEGMGVVIDSWNDADLIRALTAVMKSEVGFDPQLARQQVQKFSIDVQGPRWANFLLEYFPG